MSHQMSKINNPMKKRAIIEQVEKIILKHITPVRIYLFGSQINGEDTEASDIDIAYDSQTIENDAIIKEEVSQINTLIKIDVVNIAFAQERFKQRVISTGKVIWSSTKLLRMEDGILNFQMSIKKYADVVNNQESFDKDGYGDIFLDIAVKRFEFTFEMAWKACKRTLDYMGFATKSPREALREAYAQRFIENEVIWLNMLEQRNLSAHVYDEISVGEIKNDIIKYLQAFEELYNNLNNFYKSEVVKD